MVPWSPLRHLAHLLDRRQRGTPLSELHAVRDAQLPDGGDSVASLPRARKLASPDADGANGSTLPDWCLGWWDVHVVAAFQERRRRQNFCDKIERGIQNGQQVELCCTGASGLAVSSYYQVNAEAKFRPASKDENCIVSLSYASESADAEDLVAVSFGVSEVAKSASTKVFMQGPVALTNECNILGDTVDVEGSLASQFRAWGHQVGYGLQFGFSGMLDCPLAIWKVGLGLAGDKLRVQPTFEKGLGLSVELQAQPTKAWLNNFIATVREPWSWRPTNASVETEHWLWNKVAMVASADPSASGDGLDWSLGLKRPLGIAKKWKALASGQGRSARAFEVKTSHEAPDSVGLEWAVSYGEGVRVGVDYRLGQYNDNDPAGGWGCRVRCQLGEGPPNLDASIFVPW